MRVVPSRPEPELVLRVSCEGCRVSFLVDSWPRSCRRSTAVEYPPLL